jgi:hypothetical protein
MTRTQKIVVVIAIGVVLLTMVATCMLAGSVILEITG